MEANKRYQNIVNILPKDMEHSGQLQRYLVENSANMWAFLFPLAYNKREKIKIKKFEQGQQILEKELGIIPFSGRFWRYMDYYLSYLYFVFRYLRRKDKWIVITGFPIFLVGSTVLRWIKNLQHVYWLHDYFAPGKGLLIRVFNFLVEHYNKRLNYVLYISPKIAQKYDIYGDSGKYRGIVPSGIKKMHSKPDSSPDGVTVCGFIGILRQAQGIELLFEFLKQNPGVSLEIMGDGYAYDYYRDMSRQMGIESRVIWHGRVLDEQKMKEITTHWDIGFAPYQTEGENYSFYGDPSKIKFYFSYGLPVITTFPNQDIKDFGAGELIDYELDALSAAVDQIMGNYPSYIKGVEAISRHLDYTFHYGEKLAFLTEIHTKKAPIG